MVLAFPKVQHVFTGKEDHNITHQEANQLVENYAKNPSQSEVRSHYFGRDAVLNVLYQKEAVGMRVYYAKHDDGSPALVLVGVDKNGNDIKSGLYLQRTFPCPPFCGDDTINVPRPDFSLRNELPSSQMHN